MNYSKKMIEAARMMRPGTLNHIVVRHDQWCDLLKGRGPCNCEPEVAEPINHESWKSRN